MKEYYYLGEKLAKDLEIEHDHPLSSVDTRISTKDEITYSVKNFPIDYQPQPQQQIFKNFTKKSNYFNKFDDYDEDCLSKDIPLPSFNTCNFNKKNSKNYNFEEEENFFEDDDEEINFHEKIIFNSISTANEDNININKEYILNAFESKEKTMKLQQIILNNSDSEIIDNIISELKNNFNTIIQDKNGNYFCNDLLKKCNQEQRIKILIEIYRNIRYLCLNEFGTHPIQKIIELSKSFEEHKLILASFNEAKYIFNAAINSNGAFVIQKIINYIPSDRRKKFNLFVLGKIKELSLNMYGIGIVKQFMLHTKDSAILKEVFNCVIGNFMNIAQNQYGNYLIQEILRKWWHESYCDSIKKLINENAILLACNEFSSHICELYIVLSNVDERKKFQSLLLKNFSNQSNNSSENFSNQNKYYNKVMKKLKEYIAWNNGDIKKDSIEIKWKLSKNKK